MEYINTNHYLTCSSGLAPAQMSSTQNKVYHDGGKYPLLTKQSTATSTLGDFFCRWTVVLAAAVVGLGVVTGGAALLVLGAAVLAAGLMCGGLMAPTRYWINEKDNHKIGQVETLTMRAQMICPLIGGTITVAPGIDSTWKALVYTARNTTWALLEGYFIGKTLGSGGSSLLAGGASGTGKYFVSNLLMLQGAARTLGAADQVLFEGMLRDGESFTEAVQNKAVGGLTMFEQPFIQFYKKLNGDVKDAAGNPVPVNWQDFYGMALSALGTKETMKAALTDVNMPRETIVAVKYYGERAGNFAKGKVYELMGGLRPKDFGLGFIKDNPEQLRVWHEAIAELQNSRRNNIVKRHFNGETVSKRELFNAVREKYNKISGNSGPIHHWNYNIDNYPQAAAISPDHLVVTPDRTTHVDIHQQTNSNPSDPFPTRPPINPRHEVPINYNRRSKPMPGPVLPYPGMNPEKDNNR